jgi:hypothetical protein
LEAQITSETNNGGCKTPSLNEMIEKLWLLSHLTYTSEHIP